MNGGFYTLIVKGGTEEEREDAMVNTLKSIGMKRGCDSFSYTIGAGGLSRFRLCIKMIWFWVRVLFSSNRSSYLMGQVYNASESVHN